ncbi:T6SS phospholipase effector Tle1-like catalytic domain-containing protein [Actinobacillus vicugnae]|uniref:T6SS phospholipase effector Tle1-like catalytic domain-containing protein n=1 Tax=Actinobacillus vicugnae TaxID=2573093 RepID=UPI001240CEB0|nr:DUF2235 domain-containing protein [Actinobacillus vicugnae]
MNLTCKVIRIGVFFDGTGNNLYNDEASRSENGISNIGKLYRLYPHETFQGDKLKMECSIFTMPIYIEGVGTANKKSDSDIEQGTGSGGGKRIRQAIKKIATLRELFPKDKYKCYIDVFGFSRGAALARDFINTMNRDEPSNGFDYIFKFVGIFDTVGSFGLAGNNINYKPLTDKYFYSETRTVDYELRGKVPPAEYYEEYNFNLSPKSAEKIVHFVALDEYRENFPLSDTQDVGETYYFIGAHSDVGGGYPKKTKENIFDYLLKTSIAEAKAEIENPPNGIKFGTNWQYTDKHPEVASALKGKRFIECRGIREVSDDLQRVTFVAMYNLAVKAGVPFLPFTEKVSKENMQALSNQVAGTRYTPLPKIGMLDERWKPELKQYYDIATKNITALGSFLGANTRYNNETGTHSREKHHLKILAIYAHNSSQEHINAMQTFNPPPFGFKHRLKTNATGGIANGPRRVVANNQLVMREKYTNNSKQAKVLK